MMIVYLLENKTNGKKYVGQTSKTLEHRLNGHFKSKYLIGRALRRHGLDNFYVGILEFCESREQLNKREMYWIEYYDCKSPKGYNLTDGGDGVMDKSGVIGKKRGLGNLGKKRTDEARKKMSLSHQGIQEGANNPFYGKQHSDETKQHWSEIRKGRKQSKETREKHRQKMMGHATSEETKRKISEKHKGRKFSEEHKRKLSEAHKGQKPWSTGKKFSPELRKKLSDAHKGLKRSEKNVLLFSMRGRKHSKESLEKMSLSHKKRWAQIQGVTVQ